MNHKLFIAPFLIQLAGACSQGPDSAPEVSALAQAAESQSTLEEDFSYPGADAIFKQLKIRLLGGDGNILLVDCNGADQQIVVYSSVRDFDDEAYCFSVRGNTGSVSLELQQFYLIRTDDTHKTEVTVNDGRRHLVETLPPPNAFKGYGQGVDPEARPATLLQIRVVP
jgi:hypothetical protein